MKKLFGVTTAMTTPFHEDGSVDLLAMSQQCEMLIGKGVQCLYPVGTTGEMLRLNPEERRQIAETVVKTASGRIPVYIHCGAATQTETIALLQHAESIGADGAGVVTPQFLGLNDREMEEYYVALAESVSRDFPIYLYNIPQCAANDIKPEVAERIVSRCANVVGMKYSFADINRTLDYLRVNGGNFSVMHGCDRVFIAMLALGCDGTVSGVSGVFPEPFVNIYKAYLAGDLKTARFWQRIAARIVDILHGGSNMAYFKEALQLRGLCGGRMRKPQLDLTATEATLLREELEAFCADTGIPLAV